jgi:hypothetical protein
MFLYVTVAQTSFLFLEFRVWPTYRFFAYIKRIYTFN